MSRPVGMPAAIAGELRHNWGWLLALGVLLLMLGIVALVDSVVATITSALVFGWILLLAGIIEGVQTFRHRGSGHLLLHALNAVLAVVMTLLLAIYFVVGGVFRIVAGWGVHAPGRDWVILNGIVTLVLGVLIWAQWPASGLWVIGLFIGIDLIVVGWSQVMTALAVRSLPVQI